MELVLVGRSNVGKSSLIRQLTGLRVKVGRKPGVTRRITRYRVGELEVVDLPGFGFMSGVPRQTRERVKTQVVRYLERNWKRIGVVIEVLDACSFLEIADRWERRGQVPVDVELFGFLKDLGLEPIVAVNKIDRIYPHEREELLDQICEKLELPSPWRQWLDLVVPVSARTGEGMKRLRQLVEKRMRKHRMGRLIKYLRIPSA